MNNKFLYNISYLSIPTDTSKSLSRYWQCRRSHTKIKCAMMFLMKHAYRGRHDQKDSARHRTADHRKQYRKHPVKKHGHLNKDNHVFKKHSNKHTSDVILHKNKHSRKFMHHKNKVKRPHNVHRQPEKHLNKFEVNQGVK